ncbi:hypothetical protein CC2G_011867 [Coprinopsis cinerea AmutBmut pab1-1]|nr:hypothetical protein CC2G_011867 [Coprinopsis cinerea AmutBmut pab1-1]
MACPAYFVKGEKKIFAPGTAPTHNPLPSGHHASSTTKRKTDMVEGAQKIITNRQIDERSLPVGAHSEPGWTWAIRGFKVSEPRDKHSSPFSKGWKDMLNLQIALDGYKHRVSFNANGYGGSQ